jgi:sugar phosphate isomerase/epimerase
MTLDVAHAHIDGGKGRRLREMLTRFGERIAHVHVSDNQGKRDDHLEIGKGNIDFREVVRKLRAVRYDATITLEVFDRDRQALVTSRNRLSHFFAAAC